MSEPALQFAQAAPEPARLVLEVSRVPPSLNAHTGRSRWAYRALKTRWARYVGDAYHLARATHPHAAFAWPCPPRGRVRCTIERVTRRADPLDLDNVYGAMKPVLDALRHLRLIDDDNTRTLDLVVRQPKGPAGQTMLRITLEEIR